MTRTLAALGAGLAMLVAFGVWLRSAPETAVGRAAREGRSAAGALSEDPGGLPTTVAALGSAGASGSDGGAGNAGGGSGSDRAGGRVAGTAADGATWSGTEATGWSLAEGTNGLGAARPPRRSRRGSHDGSDRDEGGGQAPALPAEFGARPPAPSGAAPPEPSPQQGGARSPEDFVDPEGGALLPEDFVGPQLSEVPHSVRSTTGGQSPGDLGSIKWLMIELLVDPGTSDAELTTLVNDFREVYNDAPNFVLRVHEVPYPDGTDGGLLALSHRSYETGIDILQVRGVEASRTAQGISPLPSADPE